MKGAGVDRESDAGLTLVTGMREGKNWARIASDHRTIPKNLNQASRKLPIKGVLLCAGIDWFLYPFVTV